MAAFGEASADEIVRNFQSVLGGDNSCHVNAIKAGGGRARLRTPTDDAASTLNPFSAEPLASAKGRRERRPSVCVRLCVFTVVVVLTVRMETLPLEGSACVYKWLESSEDGLLKKHSAGKSRS